MPSKYVGVAPLLGMLLIASCSRPQDYLERGNKALANGDFNEASLNYRKAIQKNPQYAEAFRALGVCELRRGNSGDAVRNLERALQLRPTDDSLRVEYTDAALTVYLASADRP